MMTYDQFIEKLAQTPRNWKVYSGRIRTLGKAEDYKCPISAVCGGNVGDPLSSGTKAGLNIVLVEKIRDAADDVHRDLRDNSIRLDLLRACGLTEASS